MTNSVLAEAEKLSQKLIPCRGEPEGLQCTEAAHDPDCPALHRPAVAQALALRDERIAALEKALGRIDKGELRCSYCRATEAFECKAGVSSCNWIPVDPREIARTALADKPISDNRFSGLADAPLKTFPQASAYSELEPDV